MIEIETIVVTPFMQNARVLIDPETRTAVLVDPGGESGRILSALKEANLNCREIWLTHSHIDHCGGVKKIKEATGAKLLGHRVEKNMRSQVTQIAELYGLGSAEYDNCPEPDEYISGGEALKFGGVTFEVRFTPGHSPGHVVFYCQEMKTLIGGDTVFAGGIGRTDLPEGNEAALMKSIKDQILTLPDETIILPGHGGETTVGHERKTNPFFNHF